MYECHPPAGLIFVGLVAAVVGIILLTNIAGVSERLAGLFRRAGLTGVAARYADRPDAWRVLGGVTVGWAIPLMIWSVVQC